jgi:hypothetical protein
MSNCSACLITFLKIRREGWRMKGRTATRRERSGGGHRDPEVFSGTRIVSVGWEC